VVDQYEQLFARMSGQEMPVDLATHKPEVIEVELNH